MSESENFLQVKEDVCMFHLPRVWLFLVILIYEDFYLSKMQTNYL